MPDLAAHVVARRNAFAQAAGFLTWVSATQEMQSIGLVEMSRILGIPHSSARNWRLDLGLPTDVLPGRDENRAAFRADLSDERHGSANGYRNLGCRCGSCRVAWVAYHRAWRQMKRIRQHQTQTEGESA